MKIAIALASFSSRPSGVQRHAFSLARCLLTRSDVSAVHLIVAPWQQELVHSSGLGGDARLHLHTGNMHRGSLSRNYWYYRELPGISNALGVDIMHFAYPVPVDSETFGCPTVVTLHDLYPYDVPSNFGFPKVVVNRLILRQCLGAVDSIACVSDSTYYRLRAYASAGALQKATRIYNCVEADLQLAEPSPLPEWSGGQFLLCVAQHRRNKNIRFLIRVFDRLRLSGRLDPATRLVIIGIAGPETRLIHRAIAASGLSEHVILLDGLSEADLQWCYRNCGAVVAPSTIEGFGLPVAEALLAGCKVVCSDIPAFREVGDGHCVYVSLEGDAESAFGEAILASLRQRRREPVSLPSLAAPIIADQYMLLYRRVLVSALAGKTTLPAPPAHPRVSEK